MKVAVIDYEAGNLKSVCGVLRTSARIANINAEIIPTRDPDCVMRCDKLVLPGVGSYLRCYNKLEAISGMISAIKYSVSVRKAEFLGICVGMQLLASMGFEEDKKTGFGLIPGIVTKLDNVSVRIPHIGWNGLSIVKKHYLFTSIPSSACKAYFAHSYEYVCVDNFNVLATTVYNKVITAAIAFRNIAGVQFHPEKSHWLGVRFCENFLSWNANT